MKLRSSLIGIVLVLAAALGFVACSSWDRSTYQTLAASKAVIDQASADYTAGRIPQTFQTRQAIETARQVQTAAVEAFKTYEMTKAAGSNATGLEQYRQRVIALLDQLPAVLSPIQQLVGGTNGPAG